MDTTKLCRGTSFMFFILIRSTVVVSQCAIPSEIQGKWIVSYSEQFEFTETQQRKLSAADAVLETYNCEAFTIVNPESDTGYYFLRSLASDSTQKQCIQTFVKNNVMVYWDKSDMPADTSGLNVSDCLPDQRQYTAPPNILIASDVTSNCALFMDFLQGMYQVEVSYNDTQQDLCTGDDNSRATISGNVLMLETCQTDDVRINSVTYECRGEVESPQQIGGLSIDAPIIILSRTLDTTTTFFCARTVAFSDKVEMSLDFTPTADSEVTCDVGQDHTSASTDTDIYVAVRLISSDCDFGVCQNGASCVQELGGYTCSCPDGFEDQNCTTNTDDCDPDPCLNGATCIDGIANFTCLCADEDQFSGSLCEERDPCFSDPCVNGGTCNRIDNSTHSCDCTIGYTGKICETNIDDCDPSQCENGATCVDLIDDYSCTCPDTDLFFGINCEFRDSCFSTPCMAGGTCSRVDDTQFSCNCPANYSGNQCESLLLCSTDPCENGGTCSEVDPGDEFSCDCPVGYDGDTCEIELYCAPTNPCGNGGTCSEGAGQADCSCLNGFTGETCETKIFCITVNTCQNSATCEEPATLPGRVSCDCLPGFKGVDCETELFCETSNTCENGATCEEPANPSDRVTCDCLEGYTGLDCEIQLFCETSNTCENGATCEEPANPSDRVTCDCMEGYTGLNCETHWLKILAGCLGAGFVFLTLVCCIFCLWKVLKKSQKKADSPRQAESRHYQNLQLNAPSPTQTVSSYYQEVY